MVKKKKVKKVTKKKPAKKTAKKKPVKKKALSMRGKEQASKGPEYIENCLHFSQYDLNLYERAMLTVINHRKEMQLQMAVLRELDVNYRQQQEALKQQYEHKKAKAENALKTAKTEQAEAERKLIVLKKEIEEVYKVPVDKISYDTVTGRIFIHDQPIQKSK